MSCVGIHGPNVEPIVSPPTDVSFRVCGYGCIFGSTTVMEKLAQHNQPVEVPDC